MSLLQWLDAWAGPLTLIALLVSAGATFVLAFLTRRMLQVNERLAQIQSMGEKRDDGILGAEQVRLLPGATGSEQRILFVVWNRGLRPTHIRDCYLAYTEPGGENRVQLRFFKAAHYANQAEARFEDPTQFIGDFIASGGFLKLAAEPRDETRSIRSYQNPRLVIKPVLGPAVDMPIHDGVTKVLKEAQEHADASQERALPAS